MKVSNITHSLTYVPIHITIRFNDIELGIGTAFFYSVDGKDYLITNWHNVSGRRPWDKKPISKDAAIPNNLVVRIPYAEELDNGSKAYQMDS